MKDFSKIFFLPVNQCKVSNQYRWFTLDIGKLTHRKVLKKDGTPDTFIFGEFTIFVKGDWKITNGNKVITQRDEEDFEAISKSIEILRGSIVKEIIFSDDASQVFIIFSNGFKLQAVNTLGDNSPWKFFTIT